MNKIIERLTEIQKQNGLNNVQLAEKLGVSESQISRLKAGLREPTADLLGSVMNVFPEITLEVVQYVKELGKESESC